MTPKARSLYRCTGCGADHPRWAGRCDVCDEWNTLVEEPIPRSSSAASGGRGAARRIAGAQSLGDVVGSAEPRWKTGLDEFDFVLGGGIVAGSMVLVGGEPGIGKSTILLQVAARLQTAGHRTLYVSGEESALQVKLRAERLTDEAEDVLILGETLLETVIAAAVRLTPAVVIVGAPFT